MCCHLRRVLVALLTFTVGVTASWLFFGPAKVRSVVRREVHTELVTTVASPSYRIDMGTLEPVSKVPSPMTSIESIPGEPLKILYVGTDTKGDSNDSLHVSFLLQNVSNQAIQSYEVSCERSRGTLRNLTYTERSHGQAFRPGSSQLFVCDCKANDTLEVRVNSVGYVNGNWWTGSKPRN